VNSKKGLQKQIRLCHWHMQQAATVPSLQILQMESKEMLDLHLWLLTTA